MKEYIVKVNESDLTPSEKACLRDYHPVELIRCKNCKCSTDYTDEFAERPYHCRKNGGFHSGDWFCADAKKKGTDQ